MARDVLVDAVVREAIVIVMEVIDVVIRVRVGRKAGLQGSLHRLSEVGLEEGGAPRLPLREETVGMLSFQY